MKYFKLQLNRSKHDTASSYKKLLRFNTFVLSLSSLVLLLTANNLMGIKNS